MPVLFTRAILFGLLAFIIPWETVLNRFFPADVSDQRTPGDGRRLSSDYTDDPQNGE